MLAAAITAFLVTRARRRRTWDAELAAAEDQAGWFARQLLPQLQAAGTPGELAGGWTVGAAQVTSLEETLTGLAPRAPDGSRGERARAVRDAVREARRGVEHLVAGGDITTSSGELGELATQLEIALTPPGPDA